MSRTFRLIVCLIAVIILTPLAFGQVITLDGNGTGRIYEGMGGVSAGASSRLVIDYPEPYRSQILDYLFKPNYGASLQHLKVEIGGNMNGTSGAEASHMHTPTDQSYQRGYEWWLMEEAKKRNPDMIFSALEWGAPGWIGNGNFFSRDNINYIINFIKGAQTEHGITIHYVGIWNEAAYNINWIIDLKNALKAAGLSTQIIAADQGNSQIFLDMNQNSALREAVDVIGYHSPRGAAMLYGPSASKRVWASELAVERTDWIGAKAIARVFNRGYVGSRITSNLLWNPVSSFYDLMLFPDSGLMYANSPWSGNYRVMPVLWATAHTTQFAQPGWQYLDQASGLLGVGSYVALKHGSDFSIIIETVDSGQNQTLTFKITGGLSTGPIHVWTSNATDQFIQASDIIPANGSFTVTVAPGSIYSLTTTTGQFKGAVASPPPSAFPFPYSDTFEGYPNDQTGRYLSAINGSFEIAPCVGGRAGSCLRQSAPMVPIIWPLVAAFEPATVLGSAGWTDYQVSVDVFFEQPGAVKLMSHMFGLAVNTGNVSGYQFYLDNAGNWRLCLGNNSCFKFGTVSLPPNSWHTLSLIWDRGQMQALINGVVVTSVSDGRAPAGYAGFGTKGWTLAQFDNFRVDTVPGVGPIVPQLQMTAIVSSEAPGFEAFKAIDGLKATSWSSAFTCNGGCRALAPLPQSITLGLGGIYKVNKLRYLPRQDGASGGNITGYRVAVSTDGTTFSTVANGTWANNAVEKSASFAPIDASHIRLESTAAAEGIARVAEINVDYAPIGTVPENPVPTVSALIPPSTNAGASGFGLVVNGSNFVNGSVVRWNGVDRATTFVNPTTLTAAIPATDISRAGSANVTVFSSAPGGGVSNARMFTINPATTPPPTDPPPTDPPPTDPLPPGLSARFVKADETTMGTWKGVYGKLGYSLAGGDVLLPPSVSVTPSGHSSWTWTSSASDLKALQKASSPGRFASTWHTSTPNGSFYVDVKTTDNQVRELALYMVDWDNRTRTQTISLRDIATNAILDTRTAAGFQQGKYLVWEVRGSVRVVVQHTGGQNAVLSGVFLSNVGGTLPPGPNPPPDPPLPPPPTGAATANFVGEDSMTSGNWKGTYGTGGYGVIGDQLSFPSLIPVTPNGHVQWTWTSSPSEGRALQKASGSGRIAATWHTPTERGSFSIDVNSTDGLGHQLALYMLDWDNRGRAQTITIFDAVDNRMLDTQTVSSFGQGKYLIWNFSGRIKIVVTGTGGPNGVVSGIFF